VIEITGGRQTRINVEPELSLAPLRRYLELQNRFRADTVDVEAWNAALREDWDDLRLRAHAPLPVAAGTTEGRSW
jgi:hypothetical protein